jgi:hypothetical protein
VGPELPPEGEHDSTIFVYCGMLLPWQNPSAAVLALLDVLAARGKGRLRFIGGRHPSNDAARRGDFKPLLERIAASSQASLEPPRPFHELEKDLVTCGTAFDLMARNAERELAFTSRTVVYLACGLPVIHDNFSELAGLLRQYDAGWCLDPSDTAALSRLATRILDDPSEVEGRRANARRLVAERLTWDRTIAPLARWCAAPRLRERKDRARGSAETIRELRGQLARVEQDYRELSGRRLVKLSNFLRRLGFTSR